MTADVPSDDATIASFAELAGMIRTAAYAVWTGALIGSAPEFIKRRFEWMQNPQPGDLVFEASTALMKDRDAVAVGTLESIVWEKVSVVNPEFEWNEEEEGWPEPTEKCYHIRTLDGHPYRWSNAQMLRVPTAQMDKR